MSLSLLHTLVSAAHAKGSHHKLALDALNRLRSDHAERWHRLFLKYGTLYLEGSKAPDNEFKDFKNHVLHPRDGYWGGAPAKAQSWYHNLVEALTKEDWDTAAYCAGVLSHYCLDPLHPFHTAQSEAENNIHRAAEWTISKSYDDLRTLGERHCPCIAVTIPNDPNWLAMLVCQGADKANTQYEKLIAHYDITRGVSDPVTGFDEVGRKIVAELILYAAEMYAIILDRACAELKMTPPEVSLTAEAFMATLKMPLKWISVRITDRRERKLVEAMYDELKATGKVEKNLPEDDRVVRDLYASEILAKRQPTAVTQVFPFQNREKVVTRLERNREAQQLEGAASGRQISAQIVALKKRLPDAEPRPAPPRIDAPAVRQRTTAPSETRHHQQTNERQSSASVPMTPAHAAAQSNDTSTATRLRSKMIDIRESIDTPVRKREPSAAAQQDTQAALPPSNLSEIVSTTREYLDQLKVLRGNAPATPLPLISEALRAPEMTRTTTATERNSNLASDSKMASATERIETTSLTLVRQTDDTVSRQAIPSQTTQSIATATAVPTSVHFATEDADRDMAERSERTDRVERASSRNTTHDWSDYDDDLNETVSSEETTERTSRSRTRTRTERAPSGPRIYLTLEQDVVDAPSIGPKTAEKLYAVGIDTVDDMLKAHPMALAARLETKSITADLVTDWQDQARLVCTVPTLRGTHAQLLVGSGYRTATQVADADPEKICADILNFAISKEGQRLLREGNPPDVEKIKSWVEHARAVKAA